jgi:tRNA dimethylallyltransferase
MSTVAILTGPTGTGKTEIAIQLALSHGKVEIINADSVLIYRGMNVGAAKPDAEDRHGIPHHLMDIRDPGESFTAGDFVRGVEKKTDEIHQRGNRALIVGGTGFYLKALLYGLWDAGPSDPKLLAQLDACSNEALYKDLSEKDPAAKEWIFPNDRYRLIRGLEMMTLSGKKLSELKKEQSSRQPRFPLWVIDREKEELEKRLRLRVDKMLQSGFLEEVETLIKKYPDGPPPLNAVGYKQVIYSLKGIQPKGRKVKPGSDGIKDEVFLATRHLVKNQRTWFRGEKASKWFILEKDLDHLKEEFFKAYAPGDLREGK